MNSTQVSHVQYYYYPTKELWSHEFRIAWSAIMLPNMGVHGGGKDLWIHYNVCICKI